LILIINKYKQT